MKKAARLLLIFIIGMGMYASSAFAVFTLENSGCGGGPYPHNALFQIVGNELRTNAVIQQEDYPTGCTICIRTNDGSGGVYDEEFVITINNIPPSLTSIVRADVDSTNASTVDFTVTFRESVTGVDAGDFSLTTSGISGASIDSVSGSSTTYTVTVSTGTGVGTIRLDFDDDDSVSDGTDPVGPGDGSYSSGESYTITGDNDANLTASGVVSEPVALPTTAASTGAALDIFDFIISDGAGGDGLPVLVTQMVMHTSGTGPFSKMIFRLDGPDLGNVIGIYNGGGKTLTFSGLNVSVADGANDTYTVNAYYSDNTSLTEDQTIILSIDGDTDLTLGAGGTQMGTTSAVNNGTGTTVAVTATQLVFSAQPTSPTAINANMGPVTIQAQDAVGNTDADFTETVTLTDENQGAETDGAGSLSTTSNGGNLYVAASSGEASWANLTYDAAIDINIDAESTSFNQESSKVTVTAPDLTVVKSNDAGGSIILGNNWTWTVSICNVGSGEAVFADGEVILTDQLPDSDMGYGATSISNATSIINQGNISAVISFNVLTVSASGADVTIGSTNGRFDVNFTATPTGGTSFSNPRCGGACTVDPNALIAETNESNNTPTTDTVTVTAPDLTVSKTNDEGGTIQLGEDWVWSVSIGNVGNEDATFTDNQVILTDNLPDSDINYGATSITNAVDITNQGNISAVIAGNNLTVTASGAPVVIAAGTGRFDVEFTATPTEGGNFLNPRGGGCCMVDPGRVITESNEGNNTATDTMITTTLATVTTQAATNVGATSAMGNGNITGLGSSNPTQHGVCWNTSANPTTSDSKTEEGAASATGGFTSSITGLLAGTDYYVRAYATNEAGTAYGNEISFTTGNDGTGVPSGIQDAGPNGGDGNGDGTQDSKQTTVASLPSATGEAYLTVEISGCDQIEQVEAYTYWSVGASDPGYSYPFGLLGFTIPCSSATVRIYYHGAANLDGYIYRKYGPIPPYGGASIWYTMTGVTFGTEEIGGETVPYAQFVLTVSQLGDDTDGLPIIDQGGPGLPNPAIPTLSEWGVIIFALLMAGTAIVFMRRRSDMTV